MHTIYNMEEGALAPATTDAKYFSLFSLPRGCDDFRVFAPCFLLILFVYALLMHCFSSESDFEISNVVTCIVYSMYTYM